MITCDNSHDPLEFLIELENDYPELCTQKERPSIEDYTVKEFMNITDGCGSKTFRPWMHEHFEWACRRHDFRYLIGYEECNRIFAEIMLFFEMIVCIGQVVMRGQIHRATTMSLILPVYVIVLLFAGWYTFSRFLHNGKKQTGYASHMLVMQRHKCRHEELNPQASYNERARAQK